MSADNIEALIREARIILEAGPVGMCNMTIPEAAKTFMVFDDLYNALHDATHEIMGYQVDNGYEKGREHGEALAAQYKAKLDQTKEYYDQVWVAYSKAIELVKLTVAACMEVQKREQ